MYFCIVRMYVYTYIRTYINLSVNPQIVQAMGVFGVMCIVIFYVNLYSAI